MNSMLTGLMVTELQDEVGGAEHGWYTSRMKQEACSQCR